MTNDEMLQAAKEVGAVIDVLMLGRHDNTVFTTGELERFAATIEKRTIERCKEECDYVSKNARPSTVSYAYKTGADDCLAAISKLGEQ